MKSGLKAANEAVMLTCGGWIFSRLTGRLVCDRSDSCSPFGDLIAGGWSAKALNAFGLSWAEPMLPDIVDGADRIGELSAQAAGRIGLPAGVPVVLAPYDIVSTAHGAGVSETNTAVQWWGSTWLGVSAELRLWRHLALTAEVEGAVVLVRPRFAIRGVNSTFTSSAVGGALALGMAVPF